MKEANVVHVMFDRFKELSPEYKDRFDIKRELEAKRGDLSPEEKNNLSYSRGYCYGYIQGIHTSTNELRRSINNCRIEALEEMRKALNEDIDRQIRQLSSERK